MGMGMLFAGALTGGARAMGEMADEQIKANSMERSRQQQFADRRAALIDEMELKERYALGQEKRDAESYIAAGERGKAIGDDRRFARFREDIKSTGGGEGMSEDELRDVFNSNYNDKIVSGQKGGDRYYEPESADRRDALQAARSAGASGKVLQGIDAEYKGMLHAERQAKQDADREARDERRYREQAERDERLASERDARDERRHQQAMERDKSKPHGPEAVDQTSKLSVLKDVLAKAEASKPNRKDYRNEKSYTAAMESWGESDNGKMAKTTARRINEILDGSQPSRDETGKPSGSSDRSTGDVAALQREIAAVERGNDKPEIKQERLRILNAELEKSKSQLAQKSAVKDNQTTIPPREQRTVGMRVVAPSGPHKGKTLEWAGEGWRIVN